MFFPERIVSINSSDKVLEIGPGSDPHPRANVLLEKRFDDPSEKKEQRGNTPEIQTSLPIVFYEGDIFPFDDDEFDYVICSHVIEHVEDVEKFVSEIFRVGKKGYLEYPTIYYEYLYNFSVHRNVVKKKDDVLYYLEKTSTPLNFFHPIQSLFLQALNKGYSSLVDDLKEVMFEGFEWRQPFNVQRVGGIDLLCAGDLELPPRAAFNPGIKQRLKNIICGGRGNT